jgi:MoaA/NifB/PqqE/SkfB family radical SAM enzyme
MLKLAQGVLKSIFLHKPFNARLWLTYRCNYRCSMCVVPKNEPVTELTPDELRIACVNLKKIGVSQIVLTGGEPLLREDIVDVIRIFNEHGFVVRLQTNGGPHVSESLLDKCYAAGLRDISVSLDTLDPKVQDEICHASGVLDNALRVLKYCHKHYSSRGMVSANTVVSGKNFFELPDLIKFCNDLGIFLNPCVYVRKFSDAPFLNESGDTDGFVLTGLPKDKVDDVFKSIRGYMKKNYTIIATARFIDDLEVYMHTDKYDWHCRSGLLSFDIVPTGELAPCCDTTRIAFQEPVANVKDDDFVSRYYSKDFKEKCRTMRQSCPGCMYGCYRDPKYLTYHVPTQLEVLRKSIAFNKVLK